MNYKVQVSYGNEGASVHDISGVVDIQQYEDSFYFYNESHDVLFIAPKHTVVYIKRI